jgi:membrane protease YdiL (CAAX protease family)
MQSGLATPQKPRTNWGWPLSMAFIRLPLILMGNGAAVLAFRLAGTPVGIAAGATWSTLSVTLTNILCLGLLLWRARVEGLQLGKIIGFQRRRFLRDLAGGVLWSIALFASMMGGLFATVFAVQRIAGLTFEQVFVGDAQVSFEPPQWLTVIMVIISGVVFPILNAPVEELQYRGYAQPRLIAASGSVWLGICITAIGFGLQHMAFALTLPLALGYFVGFFTWGLGAGVIVHRQQRLAPLVIAHLISNLSFGFFPLLFILRGA